MHQIKRYLKVGQKATNIFLTLRSDNHQRDKCFGPVYSVIFRQQIDLAAIKISTPTLFKFHKIRKKICKKKRISKYLNKQTPQYVAFQVIYWYLYYSHCIYIFLPLPKTYLNKVSPSNCTATS